MLPNSRVVSAKELITIVEDNVSAIVITTTAADAVFPKDIPSDHYKVYYKDDDVGIMSWNVLNPHFMKYLRAGTNGQGFDGYQMIKEDVQESRMDHITNDVSRALSDGFIVCMQEVCKRQMQKIIEKNKEDMGIAITMADEYKDNHNLVLYPLKKFEQVALTPFINNPTIKNPTFFVTLRNLQYPHRQMNITSIHLPFGSNSAVMASLVTNFEHFDEIIYVCGDFNASSRAYLGATDSISAYEYPAFKFAVPVNIYYSHINTMENAKTKENQIDLFDHIMIFDPMLIPASQ